MRVFLTGATGFVGSHVSQALLGRGDEVVALVRDREGWLKEVPGVQKVRGELLNYPSLVQAFSSPFDVVIHCAGLTTRVARHTDYYRVNALGTYNLLRALKGASWRPRKVVYISSLNAAGPGEKDEESPESPITPYGESKLYGEFFVKDSGLSYLIVRPPVVFGPRDMDVLQFFRFITRGWAPSFFKGKRLSLVYVGTLVEALIFLLEKEQEGTFFVADGTYTWWEVAEKAAYIAGKRLRALPIFQGALTPMAAASQFYRCLTGRAVLLDREKLREMQEESWVCRTRRLSSLGFAPSRSLEDALRETLEWYRAKGLL